MDEWMDESIDPTDQVGEVGAIQVSERRKERNDRQLFLFPSPQQIWEFFSRLMLSSLCGAIRLQKMK